MILVGVKKEDLEEWGIGKDDLLWGPLKGKAKRRRIHDYRLIAGAALVTDCCSSLCLLLATMYINVQCALIKAYI